MVWSPAGTIARVSLAAGGLVLAWATASCGGTTLSDATSDAGKEVEAQVDAARPSDAGAVDATSAAEAGSAAALEAGEASDGSDAGEASDGSDANDANDGSVAAITFTVTPAFASAELGCTAQFKTTWAAGGSPPMDVTSQSSWSSSSTTIASVDANGLATALAAGSTEIEAAYQGQMAHATFIATASALTTIAVTPTPGTIDAGATLQYTAIGTYGCTGATGDITMTATWQSSAPAVATVSPSGLATGLASGTVIVTATQDGVTSNTATLTVNGVTSVVVTPPSPVQTDLGCPLQFHATAQYTDGSMQDVTTLASWSATPAIVTFDAAGLAVGQQLGTTNVYATYSGVISAPVILTEAAGTLVQLTVAPSSASIGVAATQAFSATGLFSSGNMCDLTRQSLWQSSTPSVATIVTGGSDAGTGAGVATGVAGGSTTITATWGGLVTNGATLTVQ